MRAQGRTLACLAECTLACPGRNPIGATGRTQTVSGRERPVSGTARGLRWHPGIWRLSSESNTGLTNVGRPCCSLKNLKEGAYEFATGPASGHVSSNISIYYKRHHAVCESQIVPQRP